MSEQHKFVIQGNSMAEIMRDFFMLVAKTHKVYVVDAKKGDAVYGKITLTSKPDARTGESSATEFVPGLAAFEKGLALEAGIPLGVSATLIWHNLQEPTAYEDRTTQRKAATISEIETLRQRIKELESRK